MPAAAVIPAPIAYTNVVAVKKLVVGFQFVRRTAFLRIRCQSSLIRPFVPLIVACLDSISFTLRKLECSKQVLA